MLFQESPTTLRECPVVGRKAQSSDAKLSIRVQSPVVGCKAKYSGAKPSSRVQSTDTRVQSPLVGCKTH